jgi:hypothetical protein
MRKLNCILNCDLETEVANQKDPFSGPKNLLRREIMKTQLLLGLCLSAGLLLAGPAAFADNGKGKSNAKGARAVQVQIDKKTGKKIAPDDSDAAVQATPTTAAVAGDLSKVMPAQNSDVKYNADGSMSAQLGSANLKYLVMTIDEDGNRTVNHQTADSIESGPAAKQTESGEK